MKNIIYQKWIPIHSIPERLFCEAIHDDYEGFRILLRGEALHSPMLRISFESVLAYRNIDEGSLLKTLNLLKDCEPSSFYLVQNSTWLVWFHEESYGMYEDRHIVHYAIFTSHDCIDVLSEYEPVVEWLNE